MRKNNTNNLLFIAALAASFLFSQTVTAGQFKCWRNNEGVKECGSYVPAEHSQKRVETRGDSGRIIEVKERAKTEQEIKEANRLEKIKKIEDDKIAEQKKKDSILLETFSRELEITMLRDSKIKVLEGIITVTNSNNKTLNKKLSKLKKRSGAKPSKTNLSDMKSLENRIIKNEKSIATKRTEQDVIRKRFEKDLFRFRDLKNK